MIALREASVSDLGLLKLWDTKPHVIDCDPDDDWNWEFELTRSPHWREQLMAELDGQPIGFIQIIDPQREETHYWGDIDGNKRAIDIWIGEEEHLNKGYGTSMMELAIERCFRSKEVEGILVDPLKSNTKAHRFYERLGFEFVEERKFGSSVCFIYELKRR
ncbi:aminoglycoside 6'-N-acetyltransferase [Cyclobacterium lianum]|uniref:Aminoglycoside 6'-N-acetyltransferase n=1 Tax=Cyclobacterium lianum TaxID=388280 RepID=A0A1M7QSD9_9BACT|nr:GNAT family N-acetyltransferase [Cyclobacterium lianum]SHN34673.1 aminoglycoside 6'-N-acetyltransferase [Cyclobacterium lianum]